MNKQDLIDAVADKTGATKVAAASHINSLIDVITDSLSKGDEVQIMGFGTFSVSDRAARTGRNPKTGETLQIAASKAPKFTPGANLKKACK
jgi:DNA-binding protein HU-beta